MARTSIRKSRFVGRHPTMSTLRHLDRENAGNPTMQLEHINAMLALHASNRFIRHHQLMRLHQDIFLQFQLP